VERVVPAPVPVVRVAAEPEVRVHAASPAERAARLQATMVPPAALEVPVEQTGRQAKAAPAVQVAMVVRVESVEPAESAACLERQGSPLSAESMVSEVFAASQGSAAPEALAASRKTILRPRAL